MPRLSGSIRVQSGRCKDIPRKAKMGFRLRGRVQQHSPAGSYKNTVPLLMPWQSPEQRTDYQIPPDLPQSSGVSIPQPAPLYPPFHGAGCFCCVWNNNVTALQQCCRAFVIRSVIFCCDSTGRLQVYRPSRRRAHPAQGPAPRRPEYRWENEHRDTAG